MPTNADTIRALEAAKATLEGQMAGALGISLTDLLEAIQHIADEVGAIETLNLSAATYVPTTDPFKAVTAEAREFSSQLSRIKTAFAAIGVVASAADKVLAFIK